MGVDLLYIVHTFGITYFFILFHRPEQCGSGEKEGGRDSDSSTCIATNGSDDSCMSALSLCQSYLLNSGSGTGSEGDEA